MTYETIDVVQALGWKNEWRNVAEWIEYGGTDWQRGVKFRWCDGAMKEKKV